MEQTSDCLLVVYAPLHDPVHGAAFLRVHSVQGSPDRDLVPVEYSGSTCICHNSQSPLYTLYVISVVFMAVIMWSFYEDSHSGFVQKPDIVTVLTVSGAFVWSMLTRPANSVKPGIVVCTITNRSWNIPFPISNRVRHAPPPACSSKGSM